MKAHDPFYSRIYLGFVCHEVFLFYHLLALFYGILHLSEVSMIWVDIWELLRDDDCNNVYPCQCVDDGTWTEIWISDVLFHDGRIYAIFLYGGGKRNCCCCVFCDVLEWFYGLPASSFIYIF